MKKIKQFSLKATLLTIVAALTIGFTGCSDELSGDQTEGKPGYLTVNVKTLKPRASKTPGPALADGCRRARPDALTLSTGGLNGAARRLSRAGASPIRG